MSEKSQVREKRVILHGLPDVGITGTVQVKPGKDTYVKLGTQNFSTCPFVVVVKDGDDCDEVTAGDVLKAVEQVTEQLMDLVIRQSKRLGQKVKPTRL